MDLLPSYIHDLDWYYVREYKTIGIRYRYDALNHGCHNISYEVLPEVETHRAVSIPPVSLYE